jgi:hypothetical protein
LARAALARSAATSKFPASAWASADWAMVTELFTLGECSESNSDQRIAKRRRFLEPSCQVQRSPVGAAAMG